MYWLKRGLGELVVIMALGFAALSFGSLGAHEVAASHVVAARSGGHHYSHRGFHHGGRPHRHYYYRSFRGPYYRSYGYPYGYYYGYPYGYYGYPYYYYYPYYNNGGYIQFYFGN